MTPEEFKRLKLLLGRYQIDYSMGLPELTNRDFVAHLHNYKKQFESSVFHSAVMDDCTRLRIDYNEVPHLLIGYQLLVLEFLRILELDMTEFFEAVLDSQDYFVEQIKETEAGGES